MVDAAIPRIAVLISGRGSNLKALLEAEADGQLGGRVAVVVSNRADAPGLAHANARGVETLIAPHDRYDSREAYDQALAAALRVREVSVVCLAGFMRRLSPVMCAAFDRRLLNIHPSLLPSFPGTNAVAQALAHGVKVTGATVHFVTAELDAGPIVLQAAVPVLDADDEESLATRVLAAEHRLYPEAVRRLLLERWRVDGRRVIFNPPAPGAADRTCGTLDGRD